VPLSEHEQRLLEEIEQALEAEDPKLASAVRSTDLRSIARRRTRYAAVLFVIGLVVLVGGVVYPKLLAGVPIIGVLGFLIMFAAAGYGFGQYKRASGADLRSIRPGDSRAGAPRPRRGKSPGASGRSAVSGGLVSRLEQRFLRRFDR
jgi:hypothetical protein